MCREREQVSGLTCWRREGRTKFLSACFSRQTLDRFPSVACSESSQNQPAVQACWFAVNIFYRPANFFKEKLPGFCGFRRFVFSSYFQGFQPHAPPLHQFCTRFYLATIYVTTSVLALTVLKRSRARKVRSISVSVESGALSEVVCRMSEKKLICSYGWLVLVVILLSQTRSSAAVTNAAPITLAWNAATNPSVRGYAVYYGLAAQPTTTRVSVGTNLTCRITNLIAHVAYRIYAVSYNAAGVESVPSNQLLFTPPAPPLPPAGPRLQITKLADGSMRLSYQATPGSVCAIQFASTPNPVAWQTLTNVTANSLSNVIATDISAKQVPQRFYRVALSAQPLLSAMTIARQPDGNMLLKGSAPPGATCRVLYATRPNPSSWQLRATVVADAEGRINYLDNTAKIASSRFYRMALP